MKLTSALLALILTLAALPAMAASACYSPAQLQAEQLIRLHSELMVITVTCRQGSQGQDLAAAYGAFTQKNLQELHGAEQTMIGYYKSTGKGNPVDRLDRLRTLLANDYGQRSADMSAPAFCAAYRDKVVQFTAASPADVQNEVQRMLITERSYAKPCATKAVVRKVN